MYLVHVHYIIYPSHIYLVHTLHIGQPMYMYCIIYLCIYLPREINMIAFVLHVIMPINKFKVYMPTDEPIIVYM